MSVDATALARLLDTVGDDPDFLAELAGDYLSDAAALVEELGEVTDAEGVRRRAHTLASTSATFGAHRLAGLAREVEAGATGPEQLAAVTAEWDRVRAALPAAVTAVRQG